MSMTFLIYAIIASIGSAISSGIEAAIIAINEYDFLKHRLSIKDIRKVEKIIASKSVLLSIFLFLNTFFNVIFSISVYFLMLEISELWVTLISILIITPLLFIFSETLPKIIFRANKEKLILFLLPVFHTIAILLIKIFGYQERKRTFLQIMKTIEKELGLYSLEDAPVEFLKRLSLVSEITVKEFLIPLSEVTIVPEIMTLRDFLREFDTISNPILVYSKNPMNITGYIYIRELIKDINRNVKLGKLAKTNMILVYENATIEQSLEIIKNQKRKSPIIVVNDIGQPIGIVRSDKVSKYMLLYLTGEIVKEIELNRKGNVLTLPGNFPSRLLFEYLDLKTGSLEDIIDNTTLAGILINLCNTIPEEGRTVKVGKIKLLASKVSNKDIEEVKVLI